MRCLPQISQFGSCLLPDTHFGRAAVAVTASCCSACLPGAPTGARSYAENVRNLLNGWEQVTTGRRGCLRASWVLARWGWWGAGLSVLCEQRLLVPSAQREDTIGSETDRHSPGHATTRFCLGPLPQKLAAKAVLDGNSRGLSVAMTLVLDKSCLLFDRQALCQQPQAPNPCWVSLRRVVSPQQLPPQPSSFPS